MDLTALVISGFLSAPAQVVNGLSRDRSNMDVVSIDATYQKVPVSYSYQLWRIKTPTVCTRYKQNMATYAKCTEAAQGLFIEACQHFKPLKNKDYKHRKAAEMYCYAANTYQPTVARIQSPGTNAELEEARAACNAAVANLIGGGDGRQKAEKEKVCARYHAMQDGATR